MSPSISARLLATQSDKRLLELVRKGHERAFEAVVHRYRRPLIAYCRRLGLGDSRAEDVLQQALLKAWLALQAGSEVRELRPWLYRIVHNTAINTIRSAPERRDLLVDGMPVEHPAGESELERSIAARDALADVAALPPMQRDAILLSAVDGRSHEEVASVLGISNGAVRGLIYRARATLRSAAAALIPQPLMAWAAGGASRVAPTASRLAELSAGGGGEFAGVAVKGTALAVSAALAAGAVLGPLHQQRAHSRKRASRQGVAARRAPSASEALRAAARVPSGVAANGRRLTDAPGAGATKRGAASAPVRPVNRHRGGERRGGERGDPQPILSSPPTRVHRAHVRGGGDGQQLTSGSHDGGSAGSGGPGPTQTQQSGSGDNGGSGGETDRVQQEAQEAQERQAKEAEEARERSEREAQEARERSEREAQAAGSSTGSTDH